MTISRLLILQALLACGLSTIYFIPRQTAIQPCRVKMELPVVLGEWVGKPAVVTQQEHDILAPDTQFCRKVYEDPEGDQVYVSIVLSGQDLDNSIHRPERCLSAQGYNNQDASTRTIPVAQAPGGRLPATRLYNWKQVQDKDGHVVKFYNIDYYWFIGYTDITASHFQREFIDMKDRLLHGYNQRWAFVTVESVVTKGLSPIFPGKDEAETDEMLQGVIAQVFPQIVMDAGAGKADQ